MTEPLSRTDGAELDALVIGGGLSGTLTAWLLARAGARVALVERHDLGWGASGRSVRLLEGGLGPMLAGRWGQARARLIERGRWTRAVPHLVRPCPVILLDDGRGGRWRRAWTELAPAMLARAGAAREGWPGLRRIDRETLGALAPRLVVRGDGPWLLDHDALTDGRRLTVALAGAARAAGATVLTRCEPVEIVSAPRGRRARVTLRDRLTGALARIDARAVINATGAWIDATRRWAAMGGGPRLRPAWSEVTVLEAPAVAGLRLPRAGRHQPCLMAPSLDDRAVLHPPPRRHRLADFDPERAPPPPRPAGRSETTLRQHLGAPSDRIHCPCPAPFGAGRRSQPAGREDWQVFAGALWIDLLPSHPTLRWRQAGRLVAKLLRRLGAPRRQLPAAVLPGSDVTSVAGEEAAARGRGLTPPLARWIVRRHGSRWMAVLRGSQPPEPAGGDGPPLTVAEMEWCFEEEGARTLADLFWRWRLPELFPVGRRDEEWDLARRFAHRAAHRFAWNDARLDAEWRRWQRERALAYRSEAAAEETSE